MMTMTLRLKPLSDQVIVITGASSGIGLKTARDAARQGARLVLSARSGGDLRQLASEIRARGGDAIAVEADVGVESDVERIGQEAIGAFGRIDTWVNNAGVSVYGRCLEVPIDDMRRVFDTNVWGVIHGCRVACRHMRHHGGALINVGSEVSDRAIPLQGIYSASKHAVKGWTDALRVELEDEDVPISVTLIKPGPIDTPYTRHARNYLTEAPTHVPPVYLPDSVAEAVLHAATHPVRELFVGGGAKLVATMQKISPRLTDKALGRTVIAGTHSGHSSYTHDALYTPGGGLQERGDYEGVVRKSAYTQAVLHPVMASAAAVGAGLAVVSLLRHLRQQNDREDAPDYRRQTTPT
jgi:short-subunit dehydrogenase